MAITKDISVPAFLTGGGSLGELIRAHPWSTTPLGPLESWPQSLRSALSICLQSSFPTAIYWGPELRLLYNDAWAPIPADRHPWALGRPGAEVWSDIWDVVGPQFAQVIETGQGFATFDQLLPMVRDGIPRETYWNYSITPIRGDDGSVVGIFNQGNETTAVVKARRAAEAEIERLERMFVQAPGAIAILRGSRHEFEIVNPAYEELVGRSDLVGKPVGEALPEVVSQGFVALLDEVARTGVAHVGHAVPVSLQRTPHGPQEVRLVDFVFQPLVDSLGGTSGMFVQATDVTEQKRLEEGQSLLLREMDHRVKNLFAMASGMVAMTARTARTVPEMEQALRGRLFALSKAHELVRTGLASGATPRESAQLLSLLQTILAPHTGAGQSAPRVALRGPEIEVGPRALMSLALIFHELATNAAKYGALSVESGTLAIEWTIDGKRLIVEWCESLPGAAIVAPQTDGFGSKLARSTATAQLGGSIAFHWRTDGVTVALEAALEQLGQ